MHINATKPGDERAKEDMQVEETTPSTPLRPTRAGFVRGLPLTMPVEEVIERGREAGIELQPSDIHAARYYMRQAAAADSSSIPQQLMLGGTFVTKREPRGKGAAAKAAKSSNGIGSGLGSLSDEDDDGETSGPSAVGKGAQRLRDPDYDEDDDARVSAASPVVAAPKRRGRGKAAEARPKAKPASKAEAKANGANGLHSRLQARLRNATFRDTAREEREARETNSARSARSARNVKATVGKALLMDLALDVGRVLDTDSKRGPRGKRSARNAESMEEQLRLIALRVGTQRVRELLDEMEALAARA